MPAADALAAVLDWKSRITETSMFGDYYDGEHYYRFASPKFLRRYRWVLQQSRENLCPAVVDSIASKLIIQSWEGGTEDDPAVAAMSDMADEIGLDSLIDQVHTEAPKCGDAFVLVWPDGDGVDRPWLKLASESACLPDPRRPGKMLWYAQVWTDTEGYGRVNIYYPDQLERYRTHAKVINVDLRETLQTEMASWPDSAEAYEPFSDDDGTDIITHTFGEVPAVWFPFRARQAGRHGRSILTDVVPLQDALNKSVADVIVNSESYAMPLRALLNWKPKKRLDPATGRAVETKLNFDPTREAILGIEGDGPLQQLEAGDVSKLTGLQDAFANKICRVVGLPAFYITQVTGEPPSGVSLRVLASRMTSNSRKDQKTLTPRWSEVAELLGFPGIRPVWLDPAPTDETEQLENAQARKDLGYDQETILKKLGEDPDDIARILQAKTDQAPPVGGPQLVRSFESGLNPADLAG
jgi:hypothetical protein